MEGIIYKATNKINGKCYIGQTFRTLEKRISEHIRKAKNGEYKSIFAKAILKYGEDNFDWEIIDRSNDIKELNNKEIYWIEKYNTYNGHGYNMTLGGEGVKGVFLNEETRLKMSQSRLGKTHSSHVKIKISKSLKGKLSGVNHPMFGKKFSLERKGKISESLKSHIVSEETRRKLSESHTGKQMSEEHLAKLAETRVGERNGMYGKNHSDEAKRKIGEANKGKLSGKNNPSAKAVVQLTKEGEFVQDYLTAKDGAMAVDGDLSAIIKCCKGKQKSAYGFRWMYKDDYDVRTTGD